MLQICYLILVTFLLVNPWLRLVREGIQGQSGKAT